MLSCSKKNDEEPKIESFKCESIAPSPKDDRLIGIDLLNLTETNTFDDNLALGAELGIQLIALHLNWASLEPAPNTYSDPFDALQLLGDAATANNLKFSLTPWPIDLTGKSVPTDLENTRFNDPEMIARYKSLVDFIFTKVDPSIVLNFQIGNEIDFYNTSAEPATFWEDYGIFLNEITDYMHSEYPNIKVGFTATLPGLVQEPVKFNNLLENVDALGVTYYPTASNIDVKDPSVVFDDFDALIAAFPNAEINLQEVGYQTSAKNNSTEEKQAEFFCNFFKAWDMHKNNIKTASIVRLNDLSQASAQASASNYSSSDEDFIEYLRTLGIRTYDGKGTEKQAFELIKDNLKQRGW